MYGSVEEAASYHEARGNTAWAALDDDEAAQKLTRATDYIVALLSMRDATPIPEEDAPLAIQYATYQAAWQELVNPGVLSPAFPSDKRKVLTEVQGVKWTLLQGASGSSQLWPEFPIIEGLLRPYFLARRLLPGILVV